MATKLNRCEAEYMAACALASNAKCCREGTARFREAFQRRVVGKHFDAESGHMIDEVTYFAKECADAGVGAGIVSEDGVKVGPIMVDTRGGGNIREGVNKPLSSGTAK